MRKRKKHRIPDRHALKGHLRRLAFASFLAALSIVCGKYLAFPVGVAMRFSLENLPILLAGMVLGCRSGRLSDGGISDQSLGDAWCSSDWSFGRLAVSLPLAFSYDAKSCYLHVVCPFDWLRAHQNLGLGSLLRHAVLCALALEIAQLRHCRCCRVCDRLLYFDQ